MPLAFSYGKLTFEEVRSFLLVTDNEFPTPLSANINIDAYAKKLSEFSEFSICKDGEDIVGMISCYTNRPPIGFISNACIKRMYQAQKIFTRLFHQLKVYTRAQGILRFQLEVDANNDKALCIYEHYGFRVLSINRETSKSLMELEID